VYPLLLRGWRAAFGDSISVARALSALLSLLCVPLMFDIVRRQFSAGIGLWAALILALSSAQVDHAQQIRNYPLATLFCLGAARTNARHNAFRRRPVHSPMAAGQAPAGNAAMGALADVRRRICCGD